MKKLVCLLLTAVIFFCVSTSNASTGSGTLAEFPVLNAKEISLPIGPDGTTISLFDLAYISVKDFQKLTNNKLKLWDKIGFKLTQKKIRNQLNADGTIKVDVAKKLLTKMDKTETGFHGGGFLLGVFLLWIGILIAYLHKDEKRKARIKWAWIGAGVSTLLFLFIILLFLNNWGN